MLAIMRVRYSWQPMAFGFTFEGKFGCGYVKQTCYESLSVSAVSI